MDFKSGKEAPQFVKKCSCASSRKFSSLSLCEWFVAIYLVHHFLCEAEDTKEIVASVHVSNRPSRSEDTNASTPFERDFSMFHRVRRSVYKKNVKKRIRRLRMLAADAAVAVLVLACNRVTVRLCLDTLLARRPSVRRFPIVVSQDCGHAPTAAVIASYGPRITSMRHPQQEETVKVRSYRHIARHYRWALDEIFFHLGFLNAIVVEDDLVVADDFFEYFQATLPLLRRDPTLLCVSAWNDNGKAHLVDAESPALLHRTDFFPGLGWLLTKELWSELSPKWPANLWDDWIRRPEQRRGRACIRPEVSRTSTFGREGVSRSHHYDSHIGRVILNTKFVRFTERNLDYLLRDNFDATFVRKVYNSPMVTRHELQVLEEYLPFAASVRVPYYSEGAFRRCAAEMELMSDWDSGVPRTAYRGVVGFVHKGRRVYLAPSANWKNYGKEDNATTQSNSFWLET